MAEDTPQLRAYVEARLEELGISTVWADEVIENLPDNFGTVTVDQADGESVDVVGDRILGPGAQSNLMALAASDDSTPIVDSAAINSAIDDALPAVIFDREPGEGDVVTEPQEGDVLFAGRVERPGLTRAAIQNKLGADDEANDGPAEPPRPVSERGDDDEEEPEPTETNRQVIAETTRERLEGAEDEEERAEILENSSQEFGVEQSDLEALIAAIDTTDLSFFDPILGGFATPRHLDTIRRRLQEAGFGELADSEIQRWVQSGNNRVIKIIEDVGLDSGLSTSWERIPYRDPVTGEKRHHEMRSHEYQSIIDATGSRSMANLAISVGQENDVPAHVVALANRIWELDRPTPVFDFPGPVTSREAYLKAEEDFAKSFSTQQQRARDDRRLWAKNYATGVAGGIRRYGEDNWLLAMIDMAGATDPDDPRFGRQLADYIRENGYPPDATAVDWIREHVFQGMSDAELADMGWDIRSDKFQAVTGTLGVGSGGGDVISVEQPDEVAMRQSMQNIFRSWYLSDPTEQELIEFQSSIEAQFRNNAVAKNAAKRDQTNPFDRVPFTDGEFDPTLSETRVVDVEAQRREFVRSTDQYAELFGRKPTHLTEDQYINQFETTASQLFGVEGQTDFDAIRAGLTTGDTTDTLRRLTFDKEATDNLTFAEKLARAAKTIQGLT